MSGGMSRRPGPSLAERVAATRAAAERSETPAKATALGKHCWVHAAPCSDTSKTAALLVEWRQDPGGRWEGRVIYSAHLGDRVSVIDTWVPASLLDPSG